MRVSGLLAMLSLVYQIASMMRRVLLGKDIQNVTVLSAFQLSCRPSSVDIASGLISPLIN